MTSPGFWWRAPGPTARLLSPLGTLYGAVASRRMARPGRRAELPVICVGNVTVGGSGKTPTALALADIARGLGFRPGFLTRGYGGRIDGPVLVDPAHHDAAAVGDEPLLLAAAAAVVKAVDRAAGAVLLAKHDVGVAIMDDGLQNPSLAKDLSFAVFDGAVGAGNRLCLPAGPLRAPLDRQWPLIDAALILGAGEPGRAIAADARSRGIPVFTASIVPDAVAAAGLAGLDVFAFAGIGRPAKFFETLAACGARIAETRSFPDHHAFSRREIAAVLAECAARRLVPVTTAKDAVRLRRFHRDLPVTRIATLPIHLRFDDEAGIRRLIGRAVSRGDQT